MTTAPENRLTTNAIAARIGMLRRATDMVGQERMAEALDIQPRSLRAKLGVERGITDVDLRLAAAAVRARANEILAQADAINSHLKERS